MMRENNNNDNNANNNNNEPKVAKYSQKAVIKMAIKSMNYPICIGDKDANAFLSNVEELQIIDEQQFQDNVAKAKKEHKFVPKNMEFPGMTSYEIVKNILIKKVVCNNNYIAANNEEFFNKRCIIEVEDNTMTQLKFNTRIISTKNNGYNSKFEKLYAEANLINREALKDWEYETTDIVEDFDDLKLPERYVTDEADDIFISYNDHTQDYRKETLYKHAENVRSGVYATGMFFIPKREGDLEIGTQKIGKIAKHVIRGAEHYVLTKENGNQILMYRDESIAYNKCTFITSDDDDYIVKITPLYKFDMGSAYFVVTKFEKLLDISLETFLDANTYSVQAIMPLFEAYERLNNIDQPNENQIQEKAQYRRQILKLYTQSQATIQEEIIKLVDEQEKQAKIDDVEDNQEIKMVNKNIVLTKKANGRVFNYDEDIIIKNILPKRVQIIETKMVNKVNMMMLNAQQIDSATLKGAVSYMLRENPSLDMVNEIIPTIAYIIKQTRLLEAQLQFFNQTNEVKQINALKKGEYKPKVNSLWRAMLTKQTFSYIKSKIYDLLCINKKTNVETLDGKNYAELSLDFQGGVVKH